jgi:hypothetical protein
LQSFVEPTFLSLCQKLFHAFLNPLSKCPKLSSWTVLHTFSHIYLSFHYEKLKACESFGACIQLLLLSLSLSWLPCLTHETSRLIFPLLDFKRTTNFGWNSKMYQFQCISKFLHKVFSFLSTMLTSTFKPLCPVFWLNSSFPP